MCQSNIEAKTNNIITEVTATAVPTGRRKEKRKGHREMINLQSTKLGRRYCKDPNIILVDTSYVRIVCCLPTPGLDE